MNKKLKIYKFICLFVLIILVTNCLVKLGEYKTVSKYTLQEEVKEVGNRVRFRNIKIILGIYPLDWFDENYILIKKENKNKPKIDKGQGEKSYPNNLYKYNIKTGEENLLVASTEDIGYAVLSKDKKFVLYQEGTNITATGYIYDIENKRSTRVSDPEEMPAGIGRWLDSNSIIFYSTIKGGVYISDISGYRKKIVPANGLYMRDPIKVGEKVYFVTSEYKLYEYDTETNKFKMLLSNAAEFIPSNKGNRFAFVPLGRKGIDIRNSETRKIASIYDKGAVGGFSWSGNDRDLAYIALLPDSTKEALFIANTDTWKSEQAVVDIPSTFPIILWSPSNQKLLMTGYDIKKYKNEAFAVIIELE